MPPDPDYCTDCCAKGGLGRGIAASRWGVPYSLFPGGADFFLFPSPPTPQIVSPHYHCTRYTVALTSQQIARLRYLCIFALLSLESVVMTRIVLLLSAARTTAGAMLLVLPAACCCLLVQ